MYPGKGGCPSIFYTLDPEPCILYAPEAWNQGPVHFGDH